MEEYFRVLKDSKNLNGKGFLAHSLLEMRKELLFRTLVALCIQATPTQQRITSTGNLQSISTRTNKMGAVVRQKKFASFKHSIHVFLFQLFKMYAYQSSWSIPIVCSLVDRPRRVLENGV